MLSFYFVVSVVYIICGLVAALMLRKTGPWKLLASSIVFIFYSTLPTISMIMDGKTLNNPVLEIMGRSLLVFFSVVGGALFSTAWKELRESKRSEAKNYH